MEPVNYNSINSNSIYKYIKRIDDARTQKEEDDKILQKKPGHGNLWTGKNTRPKTPELLKNYKPKC